MNCDEYLQKLRQEVAIPYYEDSEFLERMIKRAFVAGQMNGFPPAGTTHIPDDDEKNP